MIPGFSLSFKINNMKHKFKKANTAHKNLSSSILAKRLTLAELKQLKGGSGREHDLVAPQSATSSCCYSDGAPPPDRGTSTSN